MSTSLSEQVSAPVQPVVPPVVQPIDFLSIAKVALARGFPIVPLNPQTKVPCLLRWNRHPITALANAMQCAIDFPHHNVGVVGRRGVGNLLIWDIDAAGVAERMMRETGRDLPRTYTVQSRPQTKPHKKHLYFTQTEYSVRRLMKEASVKDMTVTENGKHPTIFDVKGCGGGGQVAAAGSMHDTGEVYTVSIDTDVQPIPDWLVDWLRVDIQQYRSAKHKELYERRKAEQAETQAQTSIQPVPSLGQDDAYRLIASRAGSFASLGVRREDIETLLLKQVQDFCENGKELVAHESIQSLAHRTSHNPRLRIGNAPVFGDKSFGLNLTVSAASRHSKLVKLISSFPDVLSSDDAEDRIKGVWSAYSKRDTKYRTSLYRARKEAMFSVDKKSDTWVRVVGNGEEKQ